DFSINMREKLTQATTETFNRLIDKKDVGLIKEILINDKFELEIMNDNDIEITQDISQGQRQIVALAFITSLALVAAGDEDKIAFPLFMDSPFNRLSGDNRDHLIKYIPGLTSQWILLLTDTELTVSEERVMKENDRLGNWYRLNQVETYHSEIEKVTLHETLTTRGIYLMKFLQKMHILYYVRRRYGEVYFRINKDLHYGYEEIFLVAAALGAKTSRQPHVGHRGGYFRAGYLTDEEFQL